jgi:O-glycosyl hydrolase
MEEKMRKKIRAKKMNNVTLVLRVVLATLVVGLSSPACSISNKQDNASNNGSDGDGSDPSGWWTSAAYADVPLGVQKDYANGTGAMVVNYSDIRQTIDGFGGSDAWKSNPTGQTLASLVEKLYSQSKGIGFTILRNRIPFRERYQDIGDDNPSWNDNFIQTTSGRSYNYTESASGGEKVKTFALNWNSWDLNATKNLIAKIKSVDGSPGDDFKVMSTPWTPPNNSVTRWKEGGKYKGGGGKLSYIGGRNNVSDDYTKPDIGGSLKLERYNDYADLLADYVKGFQSAMGHPLAILSIQNEPDTMTDYESCVWDGASIKSFLTVIGDRFKLKNVQTSVGVMAAEQENFKEDLVKSALTDPKAKTIVTHVAAHQYEAPWDGANYGAERFFNAHLLGKRIWQTEMGQTTAGNGVLTTGKDIANGLAYARMIHHAFTLTEANAWLYWWMWQADSDDSDALIYINGGDFSYAKRYYVIGQFSKFIRPGWTRVGSTTSPKAGVYTSAYKHENESALVYINHSSSAQTVTLDLSGGSVAWSAAYRTSVSEDMAPVANVISGSTVALSANSVTTIIGTLK